MHRSVATAPGKAIIFGEHAVVYGTTAVAASLSDLRISVDTKTEPGRSDLVVTFTDILSESDNSPSVVAMDLKSIATMMPPHMDPYEIVNPDEEVKAALNTLFLSERLEVRNAMMSVVYIVGKVLSNFVHSDTISVGLSMTVTSLGLPIGAGLGSSASFSVAAVASCLRLQALLAPQQGAQSSSIAGTALCSAEPAVPDAVSLDVINGWAFASEILLHGSPSGLDNTTSCYGGLVRFSRKGGEKFEKIVGVPPLHILLVNTKVPRSTKALVAGVRVLHDAYTDVVTPMLDSMNHIALKFLDLVEEMKSDPDGQIEGSDKYRALIKKIGDLMTMNHQLLCAVGVGHPALTAVVEAAAAASSAGNGSGEGFAAKLTGAGGGGCAIVLSPIAYVPAETAGDHAGDLERSLHTLVEALRLQGCDVHHSSIAGKGVLWVV